MRDRAKRTIEYRKEVLVVERCDNNFIWHTKFFGHLQLLDLKDAILGIYLTDGDENNERNEETGLIQFLDVKTLSFIMKEATDNAGKGKSRVVHPINFSQKG